MLDRSVKIDLGCGMSCTPGFVGVDRFPLPGVDVVCDLDRGIPLRDNSSDYVLASHSLEHLANLPAAIQEIFRICRDRAIVTIISPYDATQLNRANPYHKQVFNEHTARFFTAHATAPRVPREDFTFPHAEMWGLATSDHSNWRADLRPLHVEYFYFAPFRGLDETAKRVLRQHLSDVCDQMLTHLLVVKSPISDDEIAQVAATAQFHETHSLVQRRRLEAEGEIPGLFGRLPRLPDQLDALEQQVIHVSRHVDAVRGELTASLEQQVIQESQRVDAVREELISSLEQQVIHVSRNVDTVRKELTASLEQRLAEGEARHAGALAEMAGTLEPLSGRLAAFAAALDRLEKRAATSEEADRQREIRLAHTANQARNTEHRFETFATRLLWNVVTPRRWTERGARAILGFVPRRADLASQLHPVHRPLLEASLLENGVTSGHRLVLTSYVTDQDAFTYPLTLRDEKVLGVDLALFFVHPPPVKRRVLRLDIYDPAGKEVLRAAEVVADDEDATRPVRVAFAPLTVHGAREVQVRLFGTGEARLTGLRLPEWRRPRPFSRLFYDRRLFGRVVRARA